MRKVMSLIEFGIDNGFVEMSNDCLIIYPKRVIDSTILKRTIEEAMLDNYIAPDNFAFNQPIIMKKKKRIDMTEVIVKLFSLSLSYGVNLKVQTFAEAGNAEIHFVYKGVSVTKSFDVDMLCAMEKDYILEWFEETMQKIDGEIEDGSK